MSTDDWLHWSPAILTLTGLNFVASVVVLWLTERRGVANAALLDEVRRCNEEFIEAVELLRYGAVDEAVEVASRWRGRLEKAGSMLASARGEKGGLA